MRRAAVLALQALVQLIVDDTYPNLQTLRQIGMMRAINKLYDEPDIS
jgi:hypothetical protein